MTLKQCKDFIRLNLPDRVRPKGKTKYHCVDVFTSKHTQEAAIEHLAEKLYQKLNP